VSGGVVWWSVLYIIYNIYILTCVIFWRYIKVVSE
jgi:hypothetical protein